jgi:hypothetical protein
VRYRDGQLINDGDYAIRWRPVLRHVVARSTMQVAAQTDRSPPWSRHCHACSLRRQTLPSLLRLGKFRRDFGRLRVLVPDFLPETHAFGTRLFDSLVNTVAALGVISLNADLVLYTSFVIVP